MEQRLSPKQRDSQSQLPPQTTHLPGLPAISSIRHPSPWLPQPQPPEPKWIPSLASHPPCWASVHTVPLPGRSAILTSPALRMWTHPPLRPFQVAPRSAVSPAPPAPHDLENSRTPNLGPPTRFEHPDPLQCPPQGPGRTQLLSASLGGSDPRPHVKSTWLPASNSMPGIRDARDSLGPCHHGSASPVGTWVAPEKIC